MSQLLIRHLQSERERALNHIAECVDNGKTAEARVTKGGLNNVNALLAQILTPPPAPVPESEAPWVDPAELQTRPAKVSA